ncbi:MAG: L-rhamnose isomerase/sugar isomerase [Psychromonas sp.]
MVDQALLAEAQQNHDVVKCQEILQDAYRTDVRPLLEEARFNKGGAISPIKAYRSLKIREDLIKERGADSIATGL